MLHLLANPYLVRADGIVATTLRLFVEQANFYHGIKQLTHELIKESHIVANTYVIELFEEIQAIPIILTLTAQHSHIKHIGIFVCKPSTDQFRKLHTAS